LRRAGLPCFDISSRVPALRQAWRSIADAGKVPGLDQAEVAGRRALHIENELAPRVEDNVKRDPQLRPHIQAFRLFMKNVIFKNKRLFSNSYLG